MPGQAEEVDGRQGPEEIRQLRRHDRPRNARLTELYDESVDLSVELIRDLHAYLIGKKDALCARFDRTFGVE